MNTRQLIASSVNSTLRGAGFRGSSPTWNRTHGDVVQVINLQFHRYSDGASISYTANVGLCFPEVRSIVWGEDTPRRYNDGSCCPRVRLGYVLDGEEIKHLDKWWETIPDDDSAIADFSRALLDSCIPYLDRNSTLIEMHREASKLKSRMPILDKLYLAVISHLLGHADQRDALFAEITTPRADAWRARVERVIAQLGLTTDQYF